MKKLKKESGLYPGVKKVFICNNCGRKLKSKNIIFDITCFCGQKMNVYKS